MRYFYRVCTAAVLTLVFALPTFAGQMPCPGITDQPPPSEAQTMDETGEVFDVVMTLMQGVLSVF